MQERGGRAIYLSDLFSLGTVLFATQPALKRYRAVCLTLVTLSRLFLEFETFVMHTPCPKRAQLEFHP